MSGKESKSKKNYSSAAGIPIKEYYSPSDLSPAAEKSLGLPGSYPYTRGIHKDMYRGKLWTMRQYSGFGTAKETNQRFKYLLSQGQTGLSVAFDLPTQMGYDSDHRLAEGEVGRTGVAICSLEDMELLLEGIPLENISVSMTINATAAILLAFYLALAEKRGVAFDRLSGTVQNDILKEYISRKTYIFPPQPSLRLIADTFRFCHDRIPRWNPISISGYHMREAGATAVQELGFTFSNAICYVENALKAGLKIDEFAGSLSFFFIAGSDFFEEAAKFRTARKIWAQLMKERFKAEKEDSWKLRFHTQTSGSSLTAQQIDNNVVRVALQSLSAVLGGTQSLHANSKDEALALPTEPAVELALRTQQVIAFETKVTNTVDPLAGSYYVEHMTAEIEKRAREYMDRIDRMGGALAAIEAGFYQEEIARASYEYQKKVESGEEIVVGVNLFQTKAKQEPPILRIDEKSARDQIDRLKRLKQKRDKAKVEKYIRDLKKAASTSEILLPAILECVRNYCTLGEICDALREVWGEYRERPAGM